MVCFCEDVRAWEIRAERAAGYEDPELLKRRTGALTGPCQGKYCLQSFACLANVMPRGGVAAMPAARPPLRPVRLGDLVASEADPAAEDGAP
jgi:bacterioferritin-associated ferredoxin